MAADRANMVCELDIIKQFIKKYDNDNFKKHVEFVKNIAFKTKNAANINLSECDNLKRVMIPSGVKCIIQDAFSGCKSLKEVCVSKGGMKRVKEMLSQSGVNVDSLTFIECLE